MLRTQKDRLFIGSFHFDTARFDAGSILERSVNDTAIECAHRLEFNHITPTTNLFSSGLRLLHERVASFGAIAADVDGYFGDVLVLLEQNAVGEILQVGKGLALAANEAAGVLGFDVEKNTVL